MPRYALYYAPRPEEPLAKFARSWLGGDPEMAVPVARPDIASIGPDRLDAITAEPRRYGFHGTLKPPFDLAAVTDEGSLLHETEAFAARRAPFEFAALDLKVIDGFIALVPRGSTAEINDLAAACVENFDRFRAPPSDDDLRRRRAVGLSVRQEELLVRWGYPYVIDEFRFHLTLTGRLDEAGRAPVLAALDRLTEALRDRPCPVLDLVVFVEPVRRAPFRVLRRFPLGG